MEYAASGVGQPAEEQLECGPDGSGFIGTEGMDTRFPDQPSPC